MTDFECEHRFGNAKGEELIALAVAGKLDTAAVNALISAAIAGKADKTVVDAAIAAAVEGKLTAAQVQELIDAAMNGHNEEVKHGGCGSGTAAITALFGLLALAFVVLVKKQF